MPVVSYTQIFANTLEMTKEKPMKMDLLLHLKNRSWAQTGLQSLMHLNTNYVTHVYAMVLVWDISLEDAQLKKGLKFKDFYSLVWTKSGLFFLQAFWSPRNIEHLSFFPKGNDSMFDFLTNSWAAMYRDLSMRNPFTSE